MSASVTRDAKGAGAPAPFGRIVNVSKTFKTADQSVSAVKDVSFHFRKGDLISLLGPSGCGKTTVLKMMGGLIPATGGLLELDGKAITAPFPGVGVVYPPNLTSDPVAGLGRWTDEQIVRAVKYGERPDGRRLIPVMPWPSYSALTDADAAALVAYLRTLPPVRTPAPANSREGERPPAPYLDIVAPR